MSLKTVFLSICIVLLCADSFSQVTSESDSIVDKKYLLMHLQTLSSDAFEGRKTGAKGGVKTRKYIINQFYNLGLKPLNETYEQPFFFVHQRNEYKAANILGWIEGTEKPDSFIVISAHYDHEGIKKGIIYNGADDNASGVSALFSFAEYFKKHPPKHSVILAAFDGEEFGLKGSKYFVNNSIVPLNKIKLNINLDMISRSANNELFVVGTRYNAFLKQLIVNFKPSGNFKLTAGHDGADQQENWTYASDHTSFYKKNIPFLYFGVEDHEDYHMPSDDFENINPEFYVQAVKTIISVFSRIDTSFVH
ncbi:M28 family peptidase [Flavobacteriaceae bacterium XHP0103]|uniref:M28 family peptidase n=1 Tax=Marixanthotalea marina TaxID=2844359 RepID=UPI00298A0509|nr:M28 family peptidase [Marixanthotalea marina]MBU3822169.1 M28 family peptidase [Marixanthotalea marina]